MGFITNNIGNGILKEFPENDKKEVIESMMHFIDDEERIKIAEEIARIEERQRILHLTIFNVLQPLCKGDSDEMYKYLKQTYPEVTREEFDEIWCPDK